MKQESPVIIFDLTAGVSTDSEEVKQLNEMLSQCFLIPKDQCVSYVDILQPENYRLVRQDNQIGGGLVTVSTGHWLGGAVGGLYGRVVGGNCPGISRDWGGHNPVEEFAAGTL